MGRGHNTARSAVAFRAADYASVFATVFRGRRASADTDDARDLIGSARERNRRRFISLFGGEDGRVRDKDRGAYGLLVGRDDEGSRPYMIINGAYYSFADALDILRTRPAGPPDICYLDLDDEAAPFYVYASIGGGERQMHKLGVSLHNEDLDSELVWRAYQKTKTRELPAQP